MILDEPLLSKNSWKQFNEWTNEQMKQKTSVHLFERQIGKRQLKLNTKLS